MFWHMVANKLLTLMTNILYDSILTDMETCYKLFKREIIQDIPLRSKRFEFEPEITAKLLKRKVRIFEVPITFNPREYEEGKKIGWLIRCLRGRMGSGKVPLYRLTHSVCWGSSNESVERISTTRN